MITNVQIYNLQDKLLASLPVGRSKSKDVFRVKKIDGLEAVKAEVSFIPYSPLDGSMFQNARTGSRNLLLYIGYHKDGLVANSIERLRRDLYSQIPPKSLVRVRLISDDMPDVSIDGVVESLENLIFSKDPEIQVSIQCADANYQVCNETVQVGIAGTLERLNYTGNGSSGFLFELFVKKELEEVYLYTEEQELIYRGKLLPGDVLSISTNKRRKFARVRRPGTDVSVLKGLSTNNLDMVINARNTVFGVETKPNDPSIFRVTFTESYIGL